MCAPTSRKSVAEQDILIPDLSETNQSFLFHTSVLDFQK